MDVEQTWTDAIAAAARELWQIDLTQPAYAPILEPPSDPKFGDWTSGVALRLARELKQPPRKIAERLAERLGTIPQAARVDVAGAGYVNLTASKDVHAAEIDAARAAGDACGRSDVGRGVRVLVEHTSANPTGPLHIAHGRQAAVGDSLARILRHAGFDVGTEFFINDTGSQIENLGRSILWRYHERRGVPFRREERGVDEEGQPNAWIVADVAGNRLEFEERNLYRGDYVHGIAERVPDPPTPEACARIGKEALLEEIRRDLDAFRARFDRWTSQEALEAAGAVARLLEDLQRGGHSYPKDGALWLRSKEWGDVDDKVLVKRDGASAYRTPDIAYHRDKFERGWKRLIDLWGPDHHAHIATMRAALRLLGLLDGAEGRAFDVLIVQHCQLLKDGREVKMGKRIASYVTLRELMEEVGVDAARYFFVMRKTDSPLDFDMTLAVQQSADNPVYYVQYAHARICSVLRKALEKGYLSPADLSHGSYGGPFDSEALDLPEVTLVRHVRGLQRVVQRAAQALDPSLVCAYVHDLASAYQHYQTAGKKDPTLRILVEDDRLRWARLATISAVQAALRVGLNLIGVEAPERMERTEDEA